ncbi:zinc-binding dehydrogenase [Nocardia asteroides]|uniref:zinc-binding dehydrogenase n=1 Tax=Nocardia asteroides TaxID=1824 RepID=UPI00364B9E0A
MESATWPCRSPRPGGAYLVDPDGAGLDALAELIRRGQLRVHVDRELSLADAAAALDLVARGRTTGKIVLTVAELD